MREKEKRRWGRPPVAQRMGETKRGPWTPLEDIILASKNMVEENGVMFPTLLVYLHFSHHSSVNLCVSFWVGLCLLIYLR